MTRKVKSEAQGNRDTSDERVRRVKRRKLGEQQRLGGWKQSLYGFTKWDAVTTEFSINVPSNGLVNRV